VKAHRAVGTLDVDAVENEHVEVHVQVQRPAEALDQRHRAGHGAPTSQACPADQVRGEAAMNDAEHGAHRLRIQSYLGDACAAYAPT